MISTKMKIANCKAQIRQNNKNIEQLSRANSRLFNSLMNIIDELPIETKERYDVELASGNWQKYSKTFQKNNK